MLHSAKPSSYQLRYPVLVRDFTFTTSGSCSHPPLGKTSVSVALEHLFGFGHTQSDDFKSKKAAPQFIKNVKALLKTHDVVIADKWVNRP